MGKERWGSTISIAAAIGLQSEQIIQHLFISVLYRYGPHEESNCGRFKGKKETAIIRRRQRNHSGGVAANENMCVGRTTHETP